MVRSSNGGDAPTAPTTATVNMILSSGDGASTPETTITPANASAGKTFNIGVAAQAAAMTSPLIITPTQNCTINLDSASSYNFLLRIANGAHKVTLNLASGTYSLNAASGLGTGAVTVKVKDTVTATLANEALTWTYELPKGKTFTLGAAATITGKFRTNGATIVTPATGVCTIPTK